MDVQGEEIPATVITRILTDPLNLVAHVTMNNPFMCHFDGIVLGSGINIVDGIGGRHTVVDYQELTFQHSEHPVSGWSGAAILDESKDFTGLPQFDVPDEGSQRYSDIMIKLTHVVYK
jgi:hypothetical protein